MPQDVIAAKVHAKQYTNYQHVVLFSNTDKTNICAIALHTYIIQIAHILMLGVILEHKLLIGFFYG